MTRKPFVFVVMPFSPRLLTVYEQGIKPACEKAGAICARVDEQIFDETILERIHRQIETADLVIGEVTMPNPNVYYEVGYAKALKKDVLLVTKGTDKIPFDLSAYRHVVYGRGLKTLREQVELNVRWFLEQSPNDDCPFPIAGRWAGEVIAGNPKPIVARQQITVDFHWAGHVHGDGTIAMPGADDIHLEFTGTFRHDRFLMLTYGGSTRGTMQFGATVLRLNGTSDRFDGYYVGYGAVTDNFVYGSVSLVHIKP